MPETNGVMNGRQASPAHGRVPRKQLSDQLDRFDQMSDRLDKIIDVLAEALPEAVKEACQEGARLAVKEAIIEIFTNPDLRAMFVKMQPEPVTAMPTIIVPAMELPPPLPPKQNHWDCFKARIAAARDCVRRAASKVKNAVVARFNPIRQTVAALNTLVGEPVPIRLMLVVALLVATAVGLTCLMVPQSVAAGVSAACSASTTIAVQVGIWLKKAARKFGLVA
jgi:hypothetical protein